MQEQRELFLRAGRPGFLIRHNGIAQGFVAGPTRFGRHQWDHLFDDVLRQGGVLRQVRYDHFHRDVRLVRFPAIVIGDHRHGRVSNLRLARTLGLAQVGHPDDVIAQFVIGNGLSASAERRAFHVHVSAAIMNSRFQGTRAFQQNESQLFTNRIGKRNMPDDAAPKKCVGERLLRAVEKLVRQDNIARFVFGLKGTHGTDADDPGDAEFFHRPDIGAMIELGGQDAMTAAVAGQKCDIAPRQRSGQQLVGRRPKGRIDLGPFLASKTFYVV